MIKNQTTTDRFTFCKQIYLESIKHFNDIKVSTFAAALAYYTIFSIAPILVMIILSIGIILGNSDSKTQIINQLTSSLGSNSADLINNLINSSFNSNGQILAIVIGIAGLILAVTGFIDQLEISLNQIWERVIKRNFTQTIKHKLTQLLYIIFLGIVTVGSIFLSSKVSEINNNLSVLKLFISGIIALIHVFVVIYISFKFLIIGKTNTKSIIVGSIHSTVLLLIVQSLLSWYLTSFGTVSAYGAAGSVVVILLWVYYVGQIILFSSVVAKVFDEKTNPKETENTTKQDVTKTSGYTNQTKLRQFVTVIAAIISVFIFLTKKVRQVFKG